MLEQFRPDVVARLLTFIVLGGRGSGNFGHAGRPGEVGGSAASGRNSRKIGDRVYVGHRQGWITPQGEDFSRGFQKDHTELAREITGDHGGDDSGYNRLMQQGAVRYYIHEGGFAIHFTGGIPKTAKHALTLLKDNYEEGTRIYLDVIDPPPELSGPRKLTGFFFDNIREANRAIRIAGGLPVEQRSLGGPGSGNFGHTGRPGQVGGSAPWADTGGWVPNPKHDIPPAFSFDSQVEQYPLKGKPGIGYFKGVIDSDTHVDALLWRDKNGAVRGILNHYPKDMPPWEAKGNINIFVDPTMKRQGIGTALLVEAGKRWPINLKQQKYTAEGRPFITKLIKRMRALGGPGSGNFGHAGRPGLVGGSGPGSEIEKQTKLAEAQSNDIVNSPFVIGLNHRIDGAQRYLAAYGQRYKAAPLPAGIPRGRAKECYRNASMLVMEHPEYDFVEGLARSHATGALVFAHAWAVDKAGNVIDNTWDEPEKGEYFGVKYDRMEYLEHLYKTKLYGVLGGNYKIASDVVNGKRKMRALGGPGSGHFGHAGRPGEVGGSAPSDSPATLEEFVYNDDFPDPYLRILEEQGSSPLHKAADKHLDAVAVAIRYAFAVARKAVAKNPKNGEEIVTKVFDRELMKVLPGTLARVAVDGAKVALEMRHLGGKGSGNFGHAGRPGEVGGSAPGSGERQKENLAPHHSIKTSRLEDLPKDLRESPNMRYLNEKTSLHESAKKGIDEGLTKLQEKAPAVYKLLKDKVSFAAIPYDPPAAATTAISPDKAFILINTSEQAQKESQKPADFNVAQQIAGKGGENYTKDFYAAAFVHEAGHVMDAAMGRMATAAAMEAIIEKVGSTEITPIVDFIRKNISNYAAEGGPQEAFAEIFTKVVYDLPMPGLEELKTQMREFVNRTLAAAEPVKRTLSPELREWLLKGDPQRPDPWGEDRKAREELVQRLEGVFRAAKKSIKFNAIDKRAVKWARKHSAELVTDITETSRKAIKRAIAGLLEGEDYNDVVDRILDAVGDDDRATLIAHHETMMAVSAGQREAWDQAVEDGLLTGTEKRVWIVTPINPCPLCEELDGETAKLGGLYPGDVVGPPLHPRCRCTEGLQ